MVIMALIDIRTWFALAYPVYGVAFLLLMIPLPALMICTSPGRMIDPVPRLSRCASVPSSVEEMTSSTIGCRDQPAQLPADQAHCCRRPGHPGLAAVR